VSGLRHLAASAGRCFAEKHAAELLEAGRGIVERAQDVFAVGDREREDLHVSAVGVLEPIGEVRFVDQAGEHEDGFVVHRNPRQEHMFDRTGLCVVCLVAFGDIA
jgi:hypothetical protein